MRNTVVTVNLTESVQPEELRDRTRGQSPVSDSGDDRYKKHKRHKRSRTKERDDVREERKKHKRKHKERRERSRAPEGRTEADGVKTKREAEESPEEYDARLEREEMERLAERRRRELEAIKSRYTVSTPHNETGIRFKGRGRMKYVDPEVRQSR
ncbi:hypothetical protein OE88DRAFT_1665378 [Heliocybe sulcata]|uniref:Uncharacterized protein n=1 Tax=Heliocybe sulcata TaxID=5364 RepID=A0A5C3MRV0_9AGAM|nr:hypothetical protein OE88DRAFT_1665378 [Heliocybe sulcata]